MTFKAGNGDRFMKQVAPPEIIRRDFELLRSYEKLKTTNEVQDVLFMQSIEGRAHNGAGHFNKRTYVNTSIDDVVRALNRDPDRTKKFRQSLIDEIADFAHGVLNGRKLDRLVNAQGEPLLGFTPLKDRKVNPRDVLRGLYLGGLRDSADIRKKAEARYQVKIGCGECCKVNVRVMEAMNLDGEKLAHEAHEDRIAEYQRKGLILTNGHGADIPEEDTRFFYIRHRIGPGESDDAAVVVAGILYNIDVALGVFLADAIDTLEKYVPAFRDQDQELAFFVGRAFQDLELTMDDLLEFVYLCAIPEAEEEHVPDSSLRYLMTLEPRSNLSAIESHLAFVEGKPVPPIPVSYKRILNTEFYKYVRRRLLNVRGPESLAIPDPGLMELHQTASDVAKTNFLVVSEEEPLSEIFKKFRETKCDIVILTKKNGKIAGTLTLEDLTELGGNITPW